MHRLPQHERLIALAEDFVSQLLEESKLTPVAVSTVRLQTSTLEGLITIAEPTPADLIALVDTTESLIGFLSDHLDEMYTSQRIRFAILKTELTGLPVPRKPLSPDTLFRSCGS